MANIPQNTPPFFRKSIQSFPNTPQGIQQLLKAKDTKKTENLLKLKRTQADLELEKQARIQERDARIQADQARIQAEQTTADLIQTMRDNRLPETLIESTLKKVKIKHQEKTPPQNSEIADL